MNEPSISVVIPVFDGGHRLEQAIASIDRQSYGGDLQIIVVDDGSTDDTPNHVAELGDRVLSIRQANAGPAAARNAGLATSTGELIAFLDADDLWTDDKLECQVAALRDDPSLDVVLGRISYIPVSGAIAGTITFEDEISRSISNVQLGSGLFVRSAFDRVGMFDPTLQFSEDHDWFLRARELGLSIRILDRVTLLYHLHEDNMTRGRRPEEFLLTTVLKRSLDRRRRLAGTATELARWRSYDDRHRGTA